MLFIPSNMFVVLEVKNFSNYWSYFQDMIDFTCIEVRTHII